MFHTYLHTSLVNTIRTLISKAQRQPEQRSLDKVFPESGQLPRVLAKALVDSRPEIKIAEIEVDIWLNSQGLSEQEKTFIQLKLEGMTMEEITEDLGESAYKVRQALREKFVNLTNDRTVNVPYFAAGVSYYLVPHPDVYWAVKKQGTPEIKQLYRAFMFLDAVWLPSASQKNKRKEVLNKLREWTNAKTGKTDAGETHSEIKRA